MCCHAGPLADRVWSKNAMDQKKNGQIMVYIIKVEYSFIMFTEGINFPYSFSTCTKFRKWIMPYIPCA